MKLNQITVHGRRISFDASKADDFGVDCQSHGNDRWSFHLCDATDRASERRQHRPADVRPWFDEKICKTWIRMNSRIISKTQQCWQQPTTIDDADKNGREAKKNKTDLAEILFLALLMINLKNPVWSSHKSSSLLRSSPVNCLRVVASFVCKKKNSKTLDVREIDRQVETLAV